MGAVQTVLSGERKDPAPDGGEIQRTSFEKAVDRAFDYHPFDFPDVMVFGEWLVGPTFIIRTPWPGERYFPRKRHPGHPPPQWQLIATSLISQSGSAKIDVDVRAEGHQKKPVPTFITDKKGHRATVMRLGGKCTGRAIYVGEGAWRELAYPLYALGKKLGVTHYRILDAHTNVIYGFKDKDYLLAVFAPRTIDACELQ